MRWIPMIAARPWLLASTIGALRIFSSTVHAQVASDFIPPVQGGPADVKQPAAVKVDGKAVSGATLQDAVNAAIDQNKNEMAHGDTPEIGAKQVTFPSGLGVVATGMATYRSMENPTATRLAKRQAYIAAFTMAKKNLAEFLGGLSNEAKNEIRTSLQNVTTDKDSVTNLATASEESIRQSLDMMLRGFAVYEVKDDTKSGTVWVSVVTSPKTRGQHARSASAAVVAQDLRDGLDQVLDEVRSNIAPDGGRVVVVSTTGETAFVGFGSAIIHENENPAVQAKLNLDAQKIAKMRAQSALCGMIVGDRMVWQGQVTETTKDDVQEFREARAGDPIGSADPNGVVKLEKARQSFVSAYETSDVYQSARKGMIPPGVTTKTWVSEDKGWQFAVAVFIPSMTKSAEGAAADMDRADPQHPAPKGNDARGNTDAGNGSREGTDVMRPDKKVAPGPTTKSGDGGL